MCDTMGEVRIRSVRSIGGIGLTWGTRYLFSEEFISPLAQPLLSLPGSCFLVLTQSTEAITTQWATCSLACAYFGIPSMCHHCWSYWITSCFYWDRTKDHRLLLLCLDRFQLFLSLTTTWVVPFFWHLSFTVGAATYTHSLMLQFQSKISDHLLFTVAFWLIPSVCSLGLTLILLYLASRSTFPSHFQHLKTTRRIWIGVPLLTAALATPPDLFCQFVASSPLSALLELAIYVASWVHFVNAPSCSVPSQLTS